MAKYWLERFHMLVWMLEIGVIGIGGIMGPGGDVHHRHDCAPGPIYSGGRNRNYASGGCDLVVYQNSFFFEGILQGVFGASLALGLCYGVFMVLMTWLRPVGELFVDFSLFHFLPLPVVASCCWAALAQEGWGASYHSDAPWHPYDTEDSRSRVALPSSPYCVFRPRRCEPADGLAASSSHPSFLLAFWAVQPRRAG